MKKSSAVIYVLALMLVTAGYWAYLSNETKTIETVRQVAENTKSNRNAVKAQSVLRKDED